MLDCRKNCPSAFCPICSKFTLYFTINVLFPCQTWLLGRRIQSREELIPEVQRRLSFGQGSAGQDQPVSSSQVPAVCTDGNVPQCLCSVCVQAQRSQFIPSPHRGYCGTFSPCLQIQDGIFLVLLVGVHPMCTQPLFSSFSGRGSKSPMINFSFLSLKCYLFLASVTFRKPVTQLWVLFEEAKMEQ